jgi:hypothetical protein
MQYWPVYASCFPVTLFSTDCLWVYGCCPTAHLTYSFVLLSVFGWVPNSSLPATIISIWVYQPIDYKHNHWIGLQAHLKNSAS